MPHIIIALLLIVIVVLILRSKKKKTVEAPYQPSTQEQQTAQTVEPIVEATKIPFRRKYLLTKNELYFYKELKRIADKYNLTVLSKIRLADVVEVVNAEVDSKSEYYSYFGRIKAKHIDFALANPNNLYVMLLIEVDDNSHKNAERIERDKFVEAVCDQAKIPLIRSCGPMGLEQKIVEVLNLQNTTEEF